MLKYKPGWTNAICSKETKFQQVLNCLFDIAHCDAFKLIKTETDMLFLKHQRLENIITNSSDNSVRRNGNQQMRITKYHERKLKVKQRRSTEC